MINLKKSFERLDKDNRLYCIDKPIIGLTGGIATGKSTVSKILTEKGLQVIDADALVKSIYKTEEAKSFVQKEFPEAWNNGINFKSLREIVFNYPESKNKIENFIYNRLPEVFKKASKQVKEQNFLIYDVPLLFEKKLDKKVDLTLVVYTPRSIQRSRIVSRDGSSIEEANLIIDQQLDIEEKKKWADFVIDNSANVEELRTEVQEFLMQIMEGI